MASIRKRGSKYHRFMETKADRGDLPTSTKELHQYKVKNIINRYIEEVTSQKLSKDNHEEFNQERIINTKL